MATNITDLSRLKSTLLTSNIQQQNNALYQVINQLIDACIALNNESESGAEGLEDLTFVTATNELTDLPASRQLVGGTDITLDTTTPGQIIINADGGPGSGYWTVLTDGDPDETDLIFADGEAIAVWVPT